MITLENLSFGFPRKDLFDKISFTLEKGNHCAFIGTSGSGKSTLVDILMNPEDYLYDGALTIDPECHIGYVSQFIPVDTPAETTVFEYIGGEFIRLQNKISDICTQMETAEDIEPLLEAYQNALDAFDAIGGDLFESEIDKKLGLAQLGKHKDLLVSQLSGGEFKLIQIIKEMMNRPELLIMDEPDVFLDFDNLNGLRDLMNAHKGMLLVITHNRYLLNHCFNKIIHLENTELQEFDGPYAEYTLSLFQKKIELQEQSITDDEEIERNQGIIDNLRFIASYNTEASRGKALKARVRYQERLVARRIKAPFVDIKQPTIRLTTGNPVENTTAIKVSGLNIAFDEPLIENGTFEIKAHDKVALIGANGSGKTTLLRALFNHKEDSIEIAPEIQLAYLSQRQGEMLNESNTILEEFYYGGFNSSNAIRAHLRPYGFDSEFVKQKIDSLSGGEKNILQIAKVSSSQANFLLLDEPTSHLDTYAQIALEEAISNYEGGILMVSHDYYTIINSMDYVLIIEDKGVRRMSMRKFRKMIYANYFNMDYLQFEQKKLALETKIAMALKDYEYGKAKVLSEELEVLLASL